MMEMGKYRIWCKNRNNWEKDNLVLHQSGELTENGLGTLRGRHSRETHIVDFAIGWVDCDQKPIYANDMLQYVGCNPHLISDCIRIVWRPSLLEFGFASTTSQKLEHYPLSMILRAEGYEDGFAKKWKIVNSWHEYELEMNKKHFGTEKEDK